MAAVCTLAAARHSGQARRPYCGHREFRPDHAIRRQARTHVGTGPDPSALSRIRPRPPAESRGICGSDENDRATAAAASLENQRDRSDRSRSLPSGGRIEKAGRQELEIRLAHDDGGRIAVASGSRSGSTQRRDGHGLRHAALLSGTSRAIRVSGRVPIKSNSRPAPEPRRHRDGERESRSDRRGAQTR